MSRLSADDQFEWPIRAPKQRWHAKVPPMLAVLRFTRGPWFLLFLGLLLLWSLAILDDHERVIAELRAAIPEPEACEPTVPCNQPEPTIFVPEYNPSLFPGMAALTGALAVLAALMSPIARRLERRHFGDCSTANGHPIQLDR